MVNFIDIPARANYTFDRRRETVTTESGLVNNYYTGIGFWRGEFTPVTKFTRSELIGKLAQGDKLGGAFKVDLVEYIRMDDSEPTWIQGNALSGNNSLALYKGTDTSYILESGVSKFNRDLQVGDLISIRYAREPDYITARYITEKDTIEISGRVYNRYILNFEIPKEFFKDVADYSVINNLVEFCIDRPHITAKYLQTPISFSVSPTRAMEIAPIGWIEATGDAMRKWANNSGGINLAPEQDNTDDELADILATEGGDELVTE